MQNARLIIASSIFMLAVLSCNLAEKLIPGGVDEMKKAGDLWQDVPRMEGLAPSEMELPIAIKLIMRTVLNNLWRFNKEGEDKTPVQGDWIVFTTQGTASDVSSFYTNERMSSFGQWETGKESQCLDGKESGFNGMLCVFNKNADKRDIGLAIIAMEDDKAKQTNVFFLRLETPVNPANKTGNHFNLPANELRILKRDAHALKGFMDTS